MQKRLSTFMLPAVIAVFSAAPASAQVRVGLEFGPVIIRIAPEAPPPPRVEYRMARPSRSYVWIDGYWDRRDDRWAWAPGRWEEPAQEGSYWVRPQYQREGEAYRYEPGRWSHQRMEEGEDYSRWHKEHGNGRYKKDKKDKKDKHDKHGRDRDD